MIRTLIADDHHLVRAGIKALLEQVEDIVVVGEAADGQSTLELVKREIPEIVIMDIAMPKLNGAQAIRKITELNLAVNVVILTMYSDHALIRQSLSYGARGYLLKSSVSEELILAVRAVARGEVFLSSAISGFILEDFLQYQKGYHINTAFDSLSPREVEVLQLIAEGHTNGSIAQELCITSKTVEKHRANLMVKLNIHDTAGLVREAIKNKLVFLD